MGKPGAGHAASLRSEHIGPAEVTRETETSQYPEEEKATAIPSVAARERGAPQTDATGERVGGCGSGWRGPRGWALWPGGRGTQQGELPLLQGVTKDVGSRRPWKRPPQRVTAP